MKSRHPIVGIESSTKNGGESSCAVKRPVTVVFTLESTAFLGYAPVLI